MNNAYTPILLPDIAYGDNAVSPIDNKRRRVRLLSSEAVDQAVRVQFPWSGVGSDSDHFR